MTTTTWLISIAILLILAFERLSINFLTRTPEGCARVRKCRILHPNTISLIRIPMGVVSICFLYLGYDVISILWFAFWMITDLTDGTIARRCDLTTEVGKWLDPLSDKCMYFPVLIYFALPNVHSGEGIVLSLPWVIALVVIDSLGQASRLVSVKKAANYFGKGKTALITVLISLLAVDKLGGLPIMTTRFAYVLLISCTILAFFSLYCKIIPDIWYANTMTLANFLCGLYAIYQIHLGHSVLGLIMIFAGQFFDLFDGRLARRFGSTRHGPLFDDIADGTSFGLAIGYLIYRLLLANLSFPIAAGIATVYSLCIFFRLYRFLNSNPNLPNGIFQGMPSPAGALLAGSATLLFAEKMPIVAAVLSLVTSGLLISTIRYQHFGQRMWPALPKTMKLLFAILVLIFINLTIANKKYSLAFRIYCFSLGVFYSVIGLDLKHYFGKGESAPEEPEV